MDLVRPAGEGGAEQPEIGESRQKGAVEITEFVAGHDGVDEIIEE